MSIHNDAIRRWAQSVANGRGIHDYFTEMDASVWGTRYRYPITTQRNKMEERKKQIDKELAKLLHKFWSKGGHETDATLPRIKQLIIRSGTLHNNIEEFNRELEQIHRSGTTELNYLYFLENPLSN